MKSFNKLIEERFDPEQRQQISKAAQKKIDSLSQVGLDDLKDHKSLFV